MKVTYDKHFCAFIDILGYSKLIENASSKKKAITLIKHINSAIENGVKRNIESQTVKGEKAPFELKYKIFSDNISLTLPYPKNQKEHFPNDFFSFINTIVFIQAELITEGIFIRGALSSGYHFENENMIFSKALIKSYHLESKDSVYPRIIIDKNLFKELRKTYDDNDFNSWNNILIKDSDSYFFIDYLSYIDDMEFENDRINYLTNHKKQIVNNIESINNPYVLTKYIWLAKYHNHKIIQLTNDNNDPLIINEKLLSFSNENFKPYAYAIFFHIKNNPNGFVNVYLHDHYYTINVHFYRNNPDAKVIKTLRIIEEKQLTKIIDAIKKEKTVEKIVKYTYKGRKFHLTT